ncbi:hypothetical protein BDZ90DRAFT_231184 [Jaminaea rosea]|uniref:Uncharacterized protein n=1 Tax=Jaminaea rosea TaxID=1569628 RepID=A0A316UWM0_9BASI|nr:hypothetical protein BDZ90DRAFT_231184 [Jaminaea rosea]PWN29198.1 hypothetical protein BDZ90DRAFT_231184 [Jaminaea rosea]
MMKNLRLVCRPRQGEERRVLISVPDYAAITTVAAEKLGIQGEEVLIQIKADGDDELWEVDQSFWASLENGQTLFAKPVAGASSSAPPQPAKTTKLARKEMKRKRKEEEKRAIEAAGQAGGSSSAAARESDADDSASSSARPAKKAATPKIRSAQRQDDRAPPSSGSSNTITPSLSRPTVQSSGHSTSQNPTSSWNALTSKEQRSSRKAWTPRDDKFLWDKFRTQLDAASRNREMPSNGSEREAFFQRLIEDHGTRGRVSRILTGRTASSIGTRIRAKVKDGVAKGKTMPQPVLEFFGMWRSSPARTTSSAEAGGAGGSRGNNTARDGRSKSKERRHYVVVDDNDSEYDDGTETDASDASSRGDARSSTVLTQSAVAPLTSPSSSRSNEAGPSSLRPRSNRTSAVPADALRPVGFDNAAPQPAMRKSTVSSSSATRVPPTPSTEHNARRAHERVAAQNPFAPRLARDDDDAASVVMTSSRSGATASAPVFINRGQSPNLSQTGASRAVAVKEEMETDEQDELMNGSDSFHTPAPVHVPTLSQPPAPPPTMPALMRAVSGPNGIPLPPRTPNGGTIKANGSGSTITSSSRAGPSRWGNRAGVQFDLDFTSNTSVASTGDRSIQFLPCAGAHPEDVALLRMALDERWHGLRAVVTTNISRSAMAHDPDIDLDRIRPGRMANTLLNVLLNNINHSTGGLPYPHGAKDKVGTATARELTAISAALCVSLALAVFDCAPPNWSVRRTSFAIAGFIAAMSDGHKRHVQLRELIFVVAERVFWAMRCARIEMGPTPGASKQTSVHLCQTDAEDICAAVILTTEMHKTGMCNAAGARFDAWSLEQMYGLCPTVATPLEEQYVKYWDEAGQPIVAGDVSASRPAREAAAALLLSRFTTLLGKLEASVAFLKRCPIPLEKWGAKGAVLRRMAPALPGAVRAALSCNATGDGLGAGGQASHSMLRGPVAANMEAYSRAYNGLLNAGVLRES